MALNTPSPLPTAPKTNTDSPRHPLLATAGAPVPAIQPNDLRLGGAHPGALLLTGANTSGKSTLLRAACLTVICAQVGCYVPAAEAVLSPVDAVFSRMGAEDRILLGQSTYAVEMAEASLALRVATPSSLLVLDELGRWVGFASWVDDTGWRIGRLGGLDGWGGCNHADCAIPALFHLHRPNAWYQNTNRGTSTFDGCALAYAVLQHLTAAPAPRLLFATHYHRLTAEPALAGRLRLGHMLSELVEAGGGGSTAAAAAAGGMRRQQQQQQNQQQPVLTLRNTFQLFPGAAPNGSCGIDVAAVAGLPPSVVARARQVAAALQGTDESSLVGAKVGLTTPHEVRAAGAVAGMSQQRLSLDAGGVQGIGADEVAWCASDDAGGQQQGDWQQQQCGQQQDAAEFDGDDDDW